MKFKLILNIEIETPDSDRPLKEYEAYYAGFLSCMLTHDKKFSKIMKGMSWHSEEDVK